MTSSPKSIGVVLCTYNGEPYLREQVESVLRQSRQPDRLLILDDASRDRTVAIAEGFAKADGRIRVIRNDTRLGFAKNFEKGISLCDTDLIALCDQDDIWLPGKVARLAAELEAHPGSGIAFCNAEFMLADGTRTGHRIFEENTPAGNDPAGVRRRLLERSWSVPGQLILIDSEMKGLLLPNPVAGTHAHDEWICLNAYFLRQPRYVAEPLSLYRLHRRQASGAYDFSLKGTPFEFKKKRLDPGRLFRNLLRVVHSPFDRPRIVRERKERERNNATNQQMVLDLLIAQRRRLGLPEFPEAEQQYFQGKREEWAAVLRT